MAKDTKKSKKSKPRRKYFCCTAIRTKGGAPELVQEEIEVNDEEAAIASFKEKHKLVPASTLGPYMKYQGAPIADNKISVTCKPSEIVYTQKRWSGIFAGWKVLAHGLAAFGDHKENETVFLFFEEAVDEENPKPMPRFGSGQRVIKREALEQPKAL